MSDLLPGSSLIDWALEHAGLQATEASERALTDLLDTHALRANESQ